MSIWLVTDVVLLLGFVPCGWVILRSKELCDWVVALQMTGIIAVLVLLILAQAMSRPSFYDLAVALSLLSFPAGMMLAHFIQRLD